MTFEIYLIGFLFALAFITRLDELDWATVFCSLIWPLSLPLYAGTAVGQWYRGYVQ